MKSNKSAYTKRRGKLKSSLCRLIYLILSVASFSIQSCNKTPDPGEEKKYTATDRLINNKYGSFVQVEMKNVGFRIDEDVKLFIKKLRGELIPVQKKEHPVFDRKDSFILQIFSAEISIDTKSLSNLLNRYVFGYKDSPLKDLNILTEGTRLRQEGTMKGIPFSVLADASVTPKGKIKLHPVEMKAAGIDVEGLMNFFKLQLDEMIKLRKNHGAEIIGNDFYLDPALMLPPPRIKGHLKRLLVGKDEIIQVFSSVPAAPLKPDVPNANYMYFKGDYLTFGKLTMEKADMQIIDEDPEDPFDFFLDHYADQLIAGYHKTSKDQGLLIYMPDFDDMNKRIKE